MKRTTLILLSALALAACSEDTVAPTDDTALFDQAAELSYSVGFVADPGARIIPMVLRLPDALKLTEAQATQIKALLAAHALATRADREALAAIMQQAREAMAAGKTREEVRTILEQGAPIRLRLEAAEKQLREAVLAVLTPEQKAWLESHLPGRCAASLTDAQKTQISALIASFQQANKTDIEVIKAAYEQARAARQNGATREEVRAILEPVRPAMVRVHEAQVALLAAIKAVLTPEQLASGCIWAPVVGLVQAGR